jgi:hypothetical protein
MGVAGHQDPSRDRNQEIPLATLAQLQPALGRIDTVNGSPGWHVVYYSIVFLGEAGMGGVKRWAMSVSRWTDNQNGGDTTAV